MRKRIRKTIRFSLGEWQEIESKLSATHTEFSRFARAALLRRKLSTDVDRELLYQMQRIGNNLNQIAKVCNINKSVDREVAMQLKEINDALCQIRE
ncbi:plasmid mobilization relaxosome protein MobC [Sulfurimonas sp. HSL1-6]|uniref:plasmid mobilization protein n=1 Tax=Thiomicrolovo immobilis TaxID=3131935 RepID=UPI0031F7B29A